MRLASTKSEVRDIYTYFRLTSTAGQLSKAATISSDPLDTAKVRGVNPSFPCTCKRNMSVLTVYLYIYSQKHSGWCPCAWGAAWRCLSSPAPQPGSGGRGSWCQWTTAGWQRIIRCCLESLDTFILGLTPSWSRASFTLVALPCFTAVLTIRIGGLIFGRLQTPELCSPEFGASFRVFLHIAVQVTNQDCSPL